MTMEAREAAAARLESLERMVSELSKVRSDFLKPLDDLLRLLIRDARQTASAPHRQLHMETTTEGACFVAKEKVVEGLKLYVNVLNDRDLSRLYAFAREIRICGHGGILYGETYCSLNHRTINKRDFVEFIQFGVPIVWPTRPLHKTNKFSTRCLEQIPALLGALIEQFVQRKWIPENGRPNGCRINFFEEGEYSFPFTKLPHMEQPISTLVLSESTMAFGDTFRAFGDTTSDEGEGNYCDSLKLSLKAGSLLVMDGNSSDAAMHAMCASPNKRITITFFKVAHRFSL